MKRKKLNNKTRATFGCSAVAFKDTVKSKSRIELKKIMNLDECH